MKFIHLSDLHIGKRVNEFSMIEDQTYIFEQILNIIDDIKPDGVIIAGDVYDKSMPSEDAVQLFNWLLCQLAERKQQTYIISGNHDSAQRLAFANSLIDVTGIHISPVYNGTTVKYTLTDSFGDVNIYLLPFIKPVHVRRYFPDSQITTYTDAMQTAIDNMNVDESARNIIITHQFVTGASRSDSEEISVGGTDNVDVTVFDKFDYVALGHIHGPQKLSRETVRYCGTPLKYSFSEAKHNKSVTVVDFFEKGNVQISTIPLSPIRDLREIKGFFADITNKENYHKEKRDDYVQIVLKDENDIPDAMNQLRIVYPNLMSLKYDNSRTRAESTVEAVDNVENIHPLQLFSQLYENQNNAQMTPQQIDFVSQLIEKIWEDEQ